MKNFLKILVTFTAFIAITLVYSAVLHAEMIEPTRTLKKTHGEPGQLTVFSEPPGLAVKIDDKSVGETPLRIQEVAPGAHKLQVKDSITEIYLEPGTTFHISLFKNKFIQFQAGKKEPGQQTDPSAQAKTETWVPEPSLEQQRTKEENRKAWERWVHFVNGTSRHF